MDLLTFIAEIAKAAAWPVATVVIALVFRQQLCDLMSRVKRGKLGPAEFEFEQRVRELESETKELQLPPLSAAEAMPSPALASSDARGTVMASWLLVERAIENLASKHNLGNALTPPGSPYNINALRKAGVVPAELVSLYRDLRSLRNQAAHELEFSPSSESLLGYVRMAKELEVALQRVASAA